MHITLGGGSSQTPILTVRLGFTENRMSLPRNIITPLHIPSLASPALAVPKQPSFMQRSRHDSDGLLNVFGVHDHKQKSVRYTTSAVYVQCDLLPHSQLDSLWGRQQNRSSWTLGAASLVVE